jgi:hypothetical protein
MTTILQVEAPKRWGCNSRLTVQDEKFAID